MSDVVETLADEAPRLMMGLGLAVMFVAGAAGFEVVAAVGLALLVAGPMLGGTVSNLMRAYADEEETTASDDPLEALRDRYARGELTEAEFERKVERLLETEDAEVPGGTAGDVDASVGEAEREAELE
jgi:uncharacterized membrane protein